MTEQVKVFHCVFCGHPNRTKSARRVHNQTCTENKNREKNQVLGKLANLNNPYRNGRPKKRNRNAHHDEELLDIIAGDWSDGAYFAMAEELGVEF